MFTLCYKKFIPMFYIDSDIALEKAMSIGSNMRSALAIYVKWVSK